MQKKFTYLKNIERTQKLTKISQDTYLVVGCLYKKFRSENQMLLSFRLQILQDTTHLSETTSEILRFLSSIRYTLSETLLIVFFTLSPYEIMTFWQVPWFFDIVCYLLFFSNVRAQVCDQVSWSRCFNLKSFPGCGFSFDSITWISLFVSVISKFRPTSN